MPKTNARMRMINAMRPHISGTRRMKRSEFVIGLGGITV